MLFNKTVLLSVAGPLGGEMTPCLQQFYPCMTTIARDMTVSGVYFWK